MVTDSHLQDQVRQALERELGGDAAHVSVSVSHGVVTLAGHVATMPERWTAEAIVQRVPGVRAVANDVETRSGDGAVTADSALAEAAANALLRHDGAPIAIETVQVAVRDGWVTLSGSVPSEDHRNSAEKAVHLLPGVRGISNVLLIAPQG